MTSMRSAPLVFVALVLALAAGQCLFDRSDHDSMNNGTTLGLCLLMVVVLSIVPILLVGPRLSGWAESLLPLGLATVPVRVLDPPPKTTARF